MPTKAFPQAAIATPHYLASAAGEEVLAAGGNALDAAIAANLVLGVVAPYFCGPGGDVFAIVWDGEAHGYLGSGRSAAAATTASVQAASAEPEMPWIGAHTVTVPGAVRGWFDLLDRWGTRSFGELASAARAYADEGFPVTSTGAVGFESGRALYDRSFGAWWDRYGAVEAGTLLRQPGLGRLLTRIADDGPDAFYRGPVADAIAAAVAAAGGLLGTHDLDAHAGEWAAPLAAAYHDAEVLELPPPTQGVAALEALCILDGMTLPADEVERVHLLVEVVKVVLADRDTYVSDPAHMPLAAGELLDPAWIADRRRRVDPGVARRPDPVRPQRGGTAYLCAADADGLLVSLIQSNFLAFGSGVHVPEWGINLNNRGASFTLDTSRVNALAPRKRPMHTLIPALVLRDGRPALVLGSMGGDAQVQVHVQVLTRILADDVDPQDALDAPRWRVEPSTEWPVLLERRFDPAVSAGLHDRGHRVRSTVALDWGMGHAHAIVPSEHGYAAATDPRAEGAALGR